MAHEVLYRRWRPNRFAEIVGQEPVTTTLRHAVAAGSPAHAYLFTGPRGTGKTSMGRILATAVNCPAPSDGEPCGSCESCRSFDAGAALDLIELDAASNRGIDEIRDLREGAGYSPAAATYKLYLVDEVHMLTDAAFNALLKTLEEPPPHVIFVLATTEPHRVPATISSRCQRFDFRRIGAEETVALLRRIAAGEGIEATDEALELLARHATGSLRDAISLLDQLSAYREGGLDAGSVRSGLGLSVDARAGELARAAVRGELAPGLSVLGTARDDGLEIRAFVREVVAILRSLLLLKAGAGARAVGLSETEAAALEPLAREAGVERLVASLRALGGIDFAGDAYDSLPAEIAFAELVLGPGPAPPGEAAPSAPAPAERPARAPRPRPAPAPGRAARPRGGAPAGAPRPPPQAPARESAREPAREPAPAAGSPGGEPPPPALPEEGEIPEELARAREKWPLIQERARRRHSKAGALLNSGCYIKAVEGDRLEIGFRFPTHVELVSNAEDGAVMRAIRDAAADALERPVEVVPVLWEELAQLPRAPRPQPRAAGGGAGGGGGHLVEEALELGAARVDE